MKADALPRCAVLGSGTMGAQVALSLALGGASVSLWGRRAEGLEDARARVDEAFEFLANSGLADINEKSGVLGRVTFERNMSDAVSSAGFVIEAVAEELHVKQTVLQAAEAHVGLDAILSSTTSALSPTAVQSALKCPTAFCVAHYAQPAHLVALVEVVPGEQTAAKTTQFVTQLLEATGKTPVLCPDIPGFLWARIQHAVLREFASLVGKGLVTPGACDTILKQGYAARLPAMGAFEHADLAGLDLLNGAAAKAVWADLSTVGDPDDTPVGALFRDGKLGMKSGAGFYDWKARDAEAFKRARDEEIVRRVKIQKGADVTLAQR